MDVFKVKRMQRRRLTEKKPIGAGHIFAIAMCLFVAATFWAIWLIDARLKPTLEELAQNEAEQAVRYAINYGLSDVSLEDMANGAQFDKEKIIQQNNNFFIKSYNSEGQLTVVTLDTNAVRKYLHEKTERIQQFMRKVEAGKITIQHNAKQIIQINDKPLGVSSIIPLGRITDTALVGNLGPKIPVHFELMSHVLTNTKRHLKQTGINNIQLQLDIHVAVDVRIVMPFSTTPKVLEQNIPIAEIFIEGETPKYYGSSPSNSETK